MPSDVVRRLAVRAVADGGEPRPQGPAPAGEDGRGGPSQLRGDRRRLHGHQGQGQGERRGAPHLLRMQGVVGRGAGQPAGRDDRRTVRGNRGRPVRSGGRRARPDRQVPP